MSVRENFIIVITFLLDVGLNRSLFSLYEVRTMPWRDRKSKQKTSTRLLQISCPLQQQRTNTWTPVITSDMYAQRTFLDNQRPEPGAYQDHIVRLHSIYTDLALNLPHSIALPDEEEMNARYNLKMLKLRDPEQHSELTCNFIRPPPNRTVPDDKSLPHPRSNSIGRLQKPSSSRLTHISTSAPVMRSFSLCNVQNGRPPSSADKNSSNSCNVRKSNRSHHCTQASIDSDSKCDSFDQPPSYDDIVKNQMYNNPVSKQCTVANCSISNNTRTSNKTYECTQVVIDKGYDNTYPPPSYSDVNQTNVVLVRKQQNRSFRWLKKLKSFICPYL